MRHKEPVRVQTTFESIILGLVKFAFWFIVAMWILGSCVGD